MIDQIRASYDAKADLYTKVNRGGIDDDEFNRGWLARFSELVATGGGPVADLGCGPGFVTNHLAELGLDICGYDLSPALIATAQRLFPDLAFEVGDFTALDLADASLAGIVSRYSLIHAPVGDLAGTFGQFARLLEPDAPFLMSFFAANSAERHGSPFDHSVVTAHELFPHTVACQMEHAGFDRIEIGTRRPSERERQLGHATILARRALVLGAP